jgi:hypothetical protein
MFSKRIYVVIVVFLIMNAIPTYDTMFNSFRPGWTAFSVGETTGTFVKNIEGDVFFGANLYSFDPHFKERWHRVRIGYPLSPITIDFEQRKKQIQGRIETNWLLMRLGLTCFVSGLVVLLNRASRGIS